MDQELRALTAKIVTAYVAQNAVSPAEVANVIQAVFSSLSSIVTGDNTQDTVPAPSPAVSVKKSVTPDAIICLECGKSLKMLRRHLHSDHGMSPADYRAKWGLPADYPLTAPAYASARSEMAKKIGLGQKRKKAD